jgi:hypothetical protein
VSSNLEQFVSMGKQGDLVEEKQVLKQGCYGQVLIVAALLTLLLSAILKATGNCTVSTQFTIYLRFSVKIL